jgi:hypothetical protein
MPNQDTAGPLALEPRRRCSRCGIEKSLDGFYANPATICKACQNVAARFSAQVRKAAVALLIAAHQDEYRALLAAERARQVGLATGGALDAA